MILQFQSSESGFPGRTLLNERPVFIIRRKAFSALSAPILEDAQPHNLAPVGHKSHGALFQVNPHVSLSKDTMPSFAFQR